MSEVANERSSGQRPALVDCWNRMGVTGDRTCPELIRHVHCRNCPVYSAAAAALLDTEPPLGSAAEWTGHFAAVAAPPEAGLLSAVVFRLGTELLALSASAIREVATCRPIHSLPRRTDGAVLGLVNVRGELLVCLSLGAALGVASDRPADPQRLATGAASPPRLLVLGGKGRRFAVVPVDEVLGLVRFHRGERRELPATIARTLETFTQAILIWRGKTAGWLDDQRLFAALDRRLA